MMSPYARNRLMIAVAALALAVAGYWQQESTPPTSRQPTSREAATATEPATRQDGAVEAAFAAQRSNVQMEVQGTIKRVLSDDNDGSRHQRFIVELPSGHTVLVAHNIDLAPRIDALRAGDAVTVYGEYEWNAQGGVLHWTHRDPDGAHVAGWIKLHGRTYQ